MARANRKSALLAASFGVVQIASYINALPVIWNGAPAGSWSVAGNWSGGTPTGNDVIFGATGSVAGPATDTNVVDVDTAVNSLQFTQFGLSPAIAYHQVNIAAPSTLSVTGFGTTAFVVGTGADNLQALVYTAITGAGTLALNNGTGDLIIRQTSTTAGAQRATLDLRGLANFVTGCDDIQVGMGSGSGVSPQPLGRAAGTFYLGQTNNVTANTLTVSSQPNGASGQQSQLYLGAVNNLNIGSILFGEKKGSALVQFASGTGNTLKIRATNGTGRADMIIGAQTPEGGNPDSSSVSTVNLTNSGGGASGSVDALLGTVMIGRAGDKRSSGTGTLIFDAGTIDANDVTLGDSNNNLGAATTSTANGVAIVGVRGSGKFIVNNNLTMANKHNINAVNIGASASLAISGGSVRVGGNIVDGGGTTSFLVDANGSIQARALGSTASPIDTFAINSGTITADLGSGGTPTAAWGNVTTLTADGTNKINLAFSSDLGAGSFAVLDYSTLVGAGFSSFSLAKLPARVNAVLVDNVGNTSIDISITSANIPKWTGLTNTTWDIDTTQNWKESNSGIATKYREDLVTYSTTDTVLFDDTATGTTTVNVSMIVQPNGVTVSNSVRSYLFSGTGKISGATGITKLGTGTLTLANTGGNDFTGVVSVSGGVLATGANEVLPDAASVNVNIGGSFQVGGMETLGLVTVAGGTLAGPSGTLVGAVSLQSGTIASLGGTITISKGGTTNAATMAGNSTFVGTLTLNNGTLTLVSNNGLGDPTSVTILNGGNLTGQLHLAGGIITPEAIEVRGRSNSPVNLTPHLVNDSGTNTINSVLSMTTGGSNYTFQSDGGKLVIKGMNFDAIASGSRTVNLQGAGEGEIGASGIINTGSLATLVTLFKKDSGTWTLTGPNDYAGGTNVQGGTLATATNFSNGTLTIAAGAVAKVLPQGSPNAAAGETVLTSLAIDAAGKLDLTNNRLSYDGVLTRADIETLVKTAYVTGDWTGAGITSSLAAAASATTGKTGLAVASATDLGLAGTATLVKYTYLGDATVDGKVNTLDFNILAGNFSSPGRWFSGDFNYDGTVDSMDFGFLAGNYGKSLPISAPWLGAVVPEPSSIALLAFAGFAAACKRRK